MIPLLLLLTLLLGLHAWLLEPMVQAITALLELPALPWLALGVAAWVLAGREQA